MIRRFLKWGGYIAGGFLAFWALLEWLSDLVM